MKLLIAFKYHLLSPINDDCRVHGKRKNFFKSKMLFDDALIAGLCVVRRDIFTREQ